MGFFRDISGNDLPDGMPGADQGEAMENAGDKEENVMNDFEDANVDNDILSQILGDNVSADPGDSDIAGDHPADDKKEKSEVDSAFQGKASDQAAEEDPSGEDDLSVDDILREALGDEEKLSEEKPSGEDAFTEEIPLHVPEWNAPLLEDAPDAEVTVITRGTTINGGVSSDGPLEIMGTITGDVECSARVSIYGTISGNVSATDVMVKTKKLEGNIRSEGSVEVAEGTVVLGDIVGTSATVAGAVKGNIDVNGSVLVDSTAIVKGSIKAKSIQVNTGAVVDGYCSLNYAGVDLDEFFNER